MRVLALNGSPTMKKGMTQILLTAFLEGVHQAGGESETVFLQKKKIAGCIGCYSCWVKHPGVCLHKDDMPELLEKMRKADYLILATPVYLDGMTAQMKLFVDRTVALLDPHFELVKGHCRHRRRYPEMPKVVLLSVAGFREMDNFEPLVDHVERICRNWQTRFMGSLLRPTSYLMGMEQLFPDTVGAIKQAAQKAGRDLIEKDAMDEDELRKVSIQQFTTEKLVEQTNRYWDLCIEAGRWPL